MQKECEVSGMFVTSLTKPLKECLLKKQTFIYLFLVALVFVAVQAFRQM